MIGTLRMWLRSALVLAAVGAMVPSAHAANIYLFQWDDAETTLTGNTYKDGVLIQSLLFPDEAYAYDGAYVLWDGSMIISIDVRANIYSPGGQLSDTWRIAGNVGDRFLSPFSFLSDIEGAALQPLVNPTLTLTETGDWQTVATFFVSTGDQYIWQFRSDTEVPEPTSLALLGLGLGIVALRRRKRQ